MILSALLKQNNTLSLTKGTICTSEQRQRVESPNKLIHLLPIPICLEKRLTFLSLGTGKNNANAQSATIPLLSICEDVTQDGVELPPAIGFDVADDVTLPPRQQSFLVDPSGQDLVREFLTQYFAIYDSDSRQPLLEAYHEHATLSMAANYLSNDNRNSPAARLTAYIPNSRNILRINEREYRRRYLKTGRLQVVSFLSEFPKTTHDLMGFAVDLIVFTPAMIVLTMNGVYKETTSSGNPTRSFHRTFVVVPNSTGGFSIINDMLFITNTTSEQEEKAFGTGAPEPVPAAAPAQDDHKVMLAMLGQQTGMNDHWSMNCLQETGWDLQRALFIFNQLQSEGKIPPEAFIK